MYGTEKLDDLRVYSIKDLIAMGYGSRTSIWRMMDNDENFPAVKLPNGRVKIPRYMLREYLEGLGKASMLENYDQREAAGLV